MLQIFWKSCDEQNSPQQFRVSLGDACIDFITAQFRQANIKKNQIVGQAICSHFKQGLYRVMQCLDDNIHLMILAIAGQESSNHLMHKGIIINNKNFHITPFPYRAG